MQTAVHLQNSPVEKASPTGKTTVNPLQIKGVEMEEEPLQLQTNPLQFRAAESGQNPLQFLKADSDPLQREAPTNNPLQLTDKVETPVQKKVNNTGLPDNLKAGVENLSGYSMDDVKVHYNSEKPAQLQAFAYAQGTDIHIAPGQEQHLPHEAWHVVQQKQGRVQPTLQMKGGVAVNDDKGLEREADIMGGQAIQLRVSHNQLNENKRTDLKIMTTQCAPYGTGPGTDDDRLSIDIQPFDPHELVKAKGDIGGRAEIISSSKGTYSARNKLKHYMVVKNGFKYQFPIKHIRNPRDMSGRFRPNGGALDVKRGGAAEGFGGNQDLNSGSQVNGDISTSQRLTLNKEYKEENPNHGGAILRPHSTKAFDSPLAKMTGTISIINTNKNLAPGHSTHPLIDDINRGKTEMKGTVVIDCDDLVGTTENQDQLENEIGRRVEVERQLLLGGAPGAVASSVANEGGIFAHLVGLVAEDIMEERLNRIKPLFED